MFGLTRFQAAADHGIDLSFKVPPTIVPQRGRGARFKQDSHFVKVWGDEAETGGDALAGKN